MVKKKKEKVPDNNLEDIRVKEGLSKTALAKRAELCQKVISETERQIRDPKKETKYKILKGLNNAHNPEKYVFEDIFPNHEP